MKKLIANGDNFLIMTHLMSKPRGDTWTMVKRLLREIQFLHMASAVRMFSILSYQRCCFSCTSMTSCSNSVSYESAIQIDYCNLPIC